MIEEDINVHFLTVSVNFSGQRIDNFLYTYLKAPKSMIYRIIRTGKVRVNKGRVKFQYRLRDGDILKIPSVKKIKVRQSFVYNPIKAICLSDAVIYEDDGLLILNKPPGISVHGGSGLKLNIIDSLRILYPKTQFLELVHRLDRDTSGILLIAKSRTVLICLHEQFRSQEMQKEYLAVVCGTWNFRVTSISKPLLKTTCCNRYNNIVLIDLKNGKYARTYFQIKERFSDVATLLTITPMTGRTHQIRVHTKYATHPIIGDRIYGNYQINEIFKQLGLNRLFLHASKLRFMHPNTKKNLCIHAPVDQCFKNCLIVLRNAIINNDIAC